MRGNRHPHMTTTDVGTSLSPPPPHLPPPLLLQSAGSNYPRGKMPSHPVQFLLKSVVVRGRGKLIKKITLGVRTAGVVNSGRCQGRIRWGGGDGDDESMMAATGVERQTKKKGGQQQRTAVYCERQHTEADVGGDVGGGDVGRWRRK